MAHPREFIADVPDGIRYFETAEEFFHHDRDLNEQGGPRGLCNILTWASGWSGRRGPDEFGVGEDEPDPSGPGIPVPWVTPVLGAELLDSLPVEIPKQTFIENLRAAISGVDADQSDAPAAALDSADVAEFAWRLLQSRDSMRPASAGPATSTEAPRVPRYDAVQLHTIAAAYSVTRAYFFSKLVQRAPINREQDQEFDAVALGFTWTGGGTDPETVFWDHARSSLDALQKIADPVRHPTRPSDLDRASSVEQSGTIHELASLMVDTISAERRRALVSSGSLLLLTEIAWHFLVDTLRKSQEATAYHDWAEQLITIDMHTDGKGHTAKKRARFLNGTQPLGVAYEIAAEAIRNGLSATTLDRSRRLAQLAEDLGQGRRVALSTHDSMYRTLGHLLHTQADIRGKAHELAETRKRRSRMEVPIPNTTTASGSGGSSSPFNRVLPATPPHEERPAVAAETEMQMPSAEDGSDIISMQNVPYAVAVVTTFDIELELSLWHLHKKAFMVVIPVNVVFRADKVFKGHQVWIGYIVRPNDNQDAVEAITRPDLKSFFLVRSGDAQAIIATPGISADRLDSTNIPIVVKLCGSPLVTLPDIPTSSVREEAENYARRRTEALALPVFQDLAEAGSHLPRFSSFAKSADGGWSNTQPPQLRHGLVLEDFQAMVAALPEADATAQLALPTNLRGAPSRGYWRYWTLLGVDLADSALRYRLIGQMLGSTFGEGAPREQRRMGVAINRQRGLTRKALALMQWRQIEVVSDEALAFESAMAHYVEHLEVAPMPFGAHGGRSSLPAAQQYPVSRHTWPDHGQPCLADNSERSGR